MHIYEMNCCISSNDSPFPIHLLMYILNKLTWDYYGTLNHKIKMIILIICLIMVRNVHRCDDNVLCFMKNNGIPHRKCSRNKHDIVTGEWINTACSCHSFIPPKKYKVCRFFV